MVEYITVEVDSPVSIKIMEFQSGEVQVVAINQLSTQ